MKKKKLEGVGLSLMEITASNFDGYGVSILTITVKRGIISVAKSLFFFIVSTNYNNGGKELRIAAGIFFFRLFLYVKELTPPLDSCVECGEYCETKEYYYGDTPLCSEFCCNCLNDDSHNED